MTESTINLVINKLTRAKYMQLLANNEIASDQLYYIIDDDEVLIQNVVNATLTEALRDYVRTSDIANLNIVTANPQVQSQDNLTQLDNITIGGVTYKVNDVASDTMMFSTESYTPTPTRGLLRSAPVEPEEPLVLRTIQISGDTWKVGDVTGVEESLSELQSDLVELSETLYAEDPASGNLAFVYIDVNGDEQVQLD